MRLSTKGRYGVRAMFDLAMHYNEGPIALKSVAQRERLSEKYLEHLFASLKKAGLIVSMRGAQGGYRLGRPPGEITLGDIIRVLEGPLAPTECVMEGPDSKTCNRSAECVMYRVWGRVKEKVDEVLDGITLAEICDEQRRLQGDGYMFYI